MRCPHCHNRLIQKNGGQTRVRIQGQLIIDDEGHASAQCYWCKALIPDLPLQLKEGTPVDVERLVVKR